MSIFGARLLNHRSWLPSILPLALLLLGSALLSLPATAMALDCVQAPPTRPARTQLSRTQRLRCAPVQDAAAEPAAATFTVPGIPEDSFLKDAVYGWVEDYAYFFDRPGPGAKPVRTSRAGFFYGPAVETVGDENGKVWHKVWGDWLPQEYYHPVESSQFKGIQVNSQPQRPFGWVLRPTTPRDAPAGDPLPAAAELERYHFVELHAWQRGADGNTWYDVGPGQWVRYDTVALTTVRPRPGDVGPEEYWVDVDLTQQIFAAYEGDRMVYAGLISSGLPRWATRTGLNQVWLRYEMTPMEGGVIGDDYYYIDAVPHTMYFDGEIALHGAFWHDDFGRPKSHGCVNMPPRTAEWVWNWSQDAPNDLWVSVGYAGYIDILR